VKVYSTGGSCVYEQSETVGRGGRLVSRESRDGTLYFFRTRFPVTSNLDYTAPRHTTLRYGRCFPRRIRRRPKLYSVCSSPGALARLRFFRLLFAEVFHEDCGAPGRNLKWMPVSAPRYDIGDFSRFFSSPPFAQHPRGCLTCLLALPKFVLANYFSATALSGRRKSGICRTNHRPCRLFPSLPLSNALDVDISFLDDRYKPIFIGL